MPVNTEHPQYKATAAIWQRCRDTMAGEDTVKAAKTKYLPKLGGQDEGDYQGYLQRAYFHGVVERTIQSLAGSAFSKEPQIEQVNNVFIDAFLNDVTGTRMGIESFAQKALEEVLTVGRGGIYVSMIDAAVQVANPYLVWIKAEDIINWRYDDRTGTLDWVVLRESVPDYNEDAFDPKMVTQWRLLAMNDGRFTVQLYREMDTSEGGVSTLVPYGDEIVPLQRGQALDFIPFSFVSTHGTTPEVDLPPLLSLVNANLDLYLLMADYRHGLHFTGAPTPYFFGRGATQQVLKIGSQTAWTSEDPQSNAGMVEFEGQGLSAMKDAITDQKENLDYLGARLMASPKRQVEAAETHRIRVQTERVTLVGIAQTVSDVLTTTVQWALKWANLPSEFSIALNIDAASLDLDPAGFKALLDAYQAGTISYETLYFNYQQGGFTRPNIDADEEKETIAIQTAELGFSEAAG